MFSVNVSRISESKMWRFMFLIFAAVLLSAAKGINSVKCPDIFRIPSVYYARDFMRAVNLYAHV